MLQDPSKFAVAAPAAAAASGGAPAAAAAAPVEEKKEEEAEASDDDMGFGLFDQMIEVWVLKLYGAFFLFGDILVVCCYGQQFMFFIWFCNGVVSLIFIFLAILFYV